MEFESMGLMIERLEEMVKVKLNTKLGTGNTPPGMVGAESKMTHQGIINGKIPENSLYSDSIDTSTTNSENLESYKMLDKWGSQENFCQTWLTQESFKNKKPNNDFRATTPPLEQLNINSKKRSDKIPKHIPENNPEQIISEKHKNPLTYDYGYRTSR